MIRSKIKTRLFGVYNVPFSERRHLKNIKIIVI